MKSAWSKLILFMVVGVALALTGCSKLLSGKDVKDEATQESLYNSAQAITIAVTSDPVDGGTTSPNGNSVSEKIGVAFDISTSVTAQYIFDTWIATPSNIVAFENAQNQTTKATIKSDSSGLTITARYKLRPRLQRMLPTGNEIFTQTAIRFVFSEKMDFSKVAHLDSNAAIDISEYFRIDTSKYSDGRAVESNIGTTYFTGITGPVSVGDSSNPYATYVLYLAAGKDLGEYNTVTVTTRTACKNLAGVLMGGDQIYEFTTGSKNTIPPIFKSVRVSTSPTTFNAVTTTRSIYINSGSRLVYYPVKSSNPANAVFLMMTSSPQGVGTSISYFTVIEKAFSDSGTNEVELVVASGSGYSELAPMTYEMNTTAPKLSTAIKPSLSEAPIRQLIVGVTDNHAQTSSMTPVDAATPTGDFNNVWIYYDTTAPYFSLIDNSFLLNSGGVLASDGKKYAKQGITFQAKATNYNPAGGGLSDNSSYLDSYAVVFSTTQNPDAPALTDSRWTALTGTSNTAINTSVTGTLPADTEGDGYFNLFVRDKAGNVARKAASDGIGPSASPTVISVDTKTPTISSFESPSGIVLPVPTGTGTKTISFRFGASKTSGIGSISRYALQANAGSAPITPEPIPETWLKVLPAPSGGYYTIDYSFADGQPVAGSYYFRLYVLDPLGNVMGTVASSSPPATTVKDLVITYGTPSISAINVRDSTGFFGTGTTAAKRIKTATPGFTFSINSRVSGLHHQYFITSIASGTPATPDSTDSNWHDASWASDSATTSNDMGYTIPASVIGSGSTAASLVIYLWVRFKESPTALSNPATLALRFDPKIGSSFTVRFDSNGGSSVSDITGQTWPNLSRIPTAPNRDGYTFGGWSADGGATAEIGLSDSSYSFTDDYGATKTLTAVWAAKTYTVSFDANGGNGAADPATSAVTNWGSSVNLAAVGTLARDGYTWGGWSTNSSGTPVLTGTTWIPTGTYSATQRLYAIWTGLSYSVVFNLEGGSGTAPAISPGPVWPNGFAVPGSSGSVARSGYEFGGWSDSATGAAITGTYTPSSYTATVNLYALWNGRKFRIAYDLGNGEGTLPAGSSSDLTLGTDHVTLPGVGSLSPPSPNPEWTFKGWRTSNTGTTPDAGAAGDRFDPAGSALTVALPGYTTITLYAWWGEP